MRYFVEPTCDNPKYPCGICTKPVNRTHRYIRCNICNYKIHNCNETDENTYKKMKNYDETMFCIKCNEENLPFFPSLVEKHDDKIESQFQSSSNSIKAFFKGINEFNDNQINGSDDENLPPLNCKYLDIRSFNYTKSKQDFSIFHLNIASLSKHKDELETILSMLNYKFDTIGILETKIRNGIAPTYDINIKGYNTLSTPTESEKGGTILYIADHLKYKIRKDIDSLMYKSNELESVFIEIINPNKKNILCGCIYRHPSMDLSEFNEKYLGPLMEKITNENKTIFLLGDFNIDLMKSETEMNTQNFFDMITSNLMVPHIIYSTRISSTSKTLIDNIFSNSLNFSLGTSGNLTLSISDHLAQFLIIPENYDCLPKKHNIYKRDTKNFDRENFLLDILNIDWYSVTELHKGDPNHSFNTFEANINSVLDKYMPLKKMTKKEIKQQHKPWITIGIRKSIERREHLY